MPDAVTIGIDLGGTYTKGGVLTADNRVVGFRSIETGAEHGPDHVLEQICTLIESLQRADAGDTAPVAVGIGSPGPLSHREGIVYHTANLPHWNHVAVRERVSKAVGLPVTLDNDANVAAFGEFVAGAGVDARDMVLLTLGTGVGAGIVIDGRLHRGAFENAAEVGHMIVQLDGRPCPCGSRGCLERYASASCLAERYCEAAVSEQSDTELGKRARAGEDISSVEVAAAVRAGDALAGRIWDEACRYLAMACVNLQHTLNPQQIVFSGGLIEAGSLLFDAIETHFDDLTWRFKGDRPTLAAATLGPLAGVTGAGALARAELTPHSTNAAPRPRNA